MPRIPSLLLVPPALVAAAVSAYATDYLTIPQAQQALFPEADRFVDATVALDDRQRAAIEKLSGVRQRWKKQSVWRAEKGGAHIGWFIVDDVIGKHEYITYATALSPDAKGARHRDPDLPRDSRPPDPRRGLAQQVRG